MSWVHSHNQYYESLNNFYIIISKTHRFNKCFIQSYVNSINIIKI